MMRELKFRAWLTDYQEMVYSFNQASLGCAEIWDFTDNSIEIQVQEEVWKIEGGEPVNRIRYIKAEAELMQFTGLTDKNGKEIYEGDIIKRTTIFEDGGSDVHLGILTWDNRNSSYYLHSIKNVLSRSFGSVSENTSYEIIGSIHENPELLEQQLTK